MLDQYSLRTPLERATVYPVFGSLIGAWVGVIPMALDWDRPWQVSRTRESSKPTASTDTFGSLFIGLPFDSSVWLYRRFHCRRVRELFRLGRRRGCCRIYLNGFYSTQSGRTPWQDTQAGSEKGQIDLNAAIRAARLWYMHNSVVHDLVYQRPRCRTSV